MRKKERKKERKKGKSKRIRRGDEDQSEKLRI